MGKAEVNKLLIGFSPEQKAILVRENAIQKGAGKLPRTKTIRALLKTALVASYAARGEEFPQSWDKSEAKIVEASEASAEG